MEDFVFAGGFSNLKSPENSTAKSATSAEDKHLKILRDLRVLGGYSRIHSFQMKVFHAAEEVFMESRHLLVNDPMSLEAAEQLTIKGGRI